MSDIESCQAGRLAMRYLDALTDMLKYAETGALTEDDTQAIAALVETLNATPAVTDSLFKGMGRNMARRQAQGLPIPSTVQVLVVDQPIPGGIVGAIISERKTEPKQQGHGASCGCIACASQKAHGGHREG